MPVPSKSTIVVLDVAAKTSVLCWVTVGEAAPGPGRGTYLLCLFPGHLSLAILRVTLGTEWLYLTWHFGKMLQLWPIVSKYNLLLCALGCGLQHFSFPWMCALCVHNQDAVS